MASGTVPSLREVRCRGCNRLLGTIHGTRAVPVQCTDLLCALSPPASANEERDSFMEYLFKVAGTTPAQLGETFSMTRQGAARILASR